MKFNSGEIKITLVPHGYQLDYELFFDFTKSEIKKNPDLESPVKGSGCRDFSDDLDPKAVTKFMQDLQKLLRKAA